MNTLQFLKRYASYVVYRTCTCVPSVDYVTTRFLAVWQLFKYVGGSHAYLMSFASWFHYRQGHLSEKITWVNRAFASRASSLAFSRCFVLYLVWLEINLKLHFTRTQGVRVGNCALIQKENTDSAEKHKTPTNWCYSGFVLSQLSTALCRIPWRVDHSSRDVTPLACLRIFPIIGRAIFPAFRQSNRCSHW